MRVALRTTCRTDHMVVVLPKLSLYLHKSDQTNSRRKFVKQAWNWLAWFDFFSSQHCLCDIYIQYIGSGFFSSSSDRHCESLPRIESDIVFTLPLIIVGIYHWTVALILYPLVTRHFSASSFSLVKNLGVQLQVGTIHAQLRRACAHLTRAYDFWTIY